MAFSASGFYPAFNGIHRYVSADPLATINTSGYFNDAAGHLKVSDLIFHRDTTLNKLNVFVVLSNSAGVVDVNDGTELVADTSTDSD